MFLNAIGGTAYGSLGSLMAPATPMSKSLAEITEALQQHLKPKLMIIAGVFTNATRTPKRTMSLNSATWLRSAVSQVINLTKRSVTVSFVAY